MSTKAGAFQGPAPIALGDIRNLEAYVRRIALRISSEPDELEELIGEGIALAYARYCEAPETSLEQRLGVWLESRLRDDWRSRHPEWRRNSRGGTATALPAATGLASEYGDEDLRVSGGRDYEIADSRLALQTFQSEADLRDPRKTGKYLGRPSAAAVATRKAEEIWATIKAERAAITPSFDFKRNPAD